MRGNMDPLAPTTHTLGPAISHIAETAASLSSSMQGMQTRPPQGLGISVQMEGEDNEAEAAAKKQKEKDTVRWVLDTPRRLQEMIDQDQDEVAEKEWEEVRKILDRWQGVAGVRELRERCEAILMDEEESD